jgi:farnesyl diphosphate synthase
MRERIEAALAESLPGTDNDPGELISAMRHALLDGGKRLRPLLVHAAGRLAGAPPRSLDAPACAVEMIHAYSLVHDDLPAMDDDRLRRGKPTIHVRFGEATAILAGDALQSLAFETLARARHPVSARRVAMIRELATGAGATGMAGGQAMDLAMTATRPDAAQLERLHGMKTGALIRTAVRLGLMAADTPTGPISDTLERCAAEFGLAFQIQDDVLDVVGETGTLGKHGGGDAARAHPTFVSVLGLDASRERLGALYSSVERRLEPFGERAALFGAILEEVRDRQH